MLDETALRTPEFVEGSRIPLADGQEWSIRKPRIVIRPRFGKPHTVTVGNAKVDLNVTVSHEASYGPAHKPFTDVLFSDETDDFKLLEAQFGLLAGLLRENYSLTNEDVGALLVVTPGDPQNESDWTKIRRAIAGLTPTPEPETATTS